MNAVVKNLILNATKAVGADVDEVLSYVMEQLTPKQYEEAKAFLTWSFTNKKYFGWGNIDDRVREFKAASGHCEACGKKAGPSGLNKSKGLLVCEYCG
jgi:formylmethanofuran dehydrogenase subunit E